MRGRFAHVPAGRSGPGLRPAGTGHASPGRATPSPGPAHDSRLRVVPGGLRPLSVRRRRPLRRAAWLGSATTLDDFVAWPDFSLGYLPPGGADAVMLLDLPAGRGRRAHGRRPPGLRTAALWPTTPGASPWPTSSSSMAGGGARWRPAEPPAAPGAAVPSAVVGHAAICWWWAAARPARPPPSAAPPPACRSWCATRRPSPATRPAATASPPRPCGSSNTSGSTRRRSTGGSRSARWWCAPPAAGSWSCRSRPTGCSPPSPPGRRSTPRCSTSPPGGGAEIRPGRGARRSLQDVGVEGGAGRGSSGRRPPCTARYVVAADGMYSTVRRLTGGSRALIWASGTPSGSTSPASPTGACGSSSNPTSCRATPGSSRSPAVGPMSGSGSPAGPGVSVRPMAAQWRDLLERPAMRAVLGDAEPEGHHRAWPIPADLGPGAAVLGPGALRRRRRRRHRPHDRRRDRPGAAHRGPGRRGHRRRRHRSRRGRSALPAAVEHHLAPDVRFAAALGRILRSRRGPGRGTGRRPHALDAAELRPLAVRGLSPGPGPHPVPLAAGGLHRAGRLPGGVTSPASLYWLNHACMLWAIRRSVTRGVSGCIAWRVRRGRHHRG